MSKYIDAEKLRSVLQNTINSMKEKDAKGERYDAFLNGKLSICEELLGCITSLQQEQPEVDLELEIERIVKNEEKFMKFQVRHQLIGYVARHFAEWGAIHLNARKEENI